MSNNYLFTFQPTFTQGLILGQLSILILIGLILRYLFLDSTQYPFETSTYHPRVDNDVLPRKRKLDTTVEEKTSPNDEQEQATESAEWFNVLLKQVVDIYRQKIRDDLPGIEGDEVARRKIEEYANRIRPPGFLDNIKIHSVDLGISAPRLFNAQRRQQNGDGQMETEFDTTYVDTISLSLSTSYLFNYPMVSFARLPIALTISLSQFKSSVGDKVASLVVSGLHRDPADGPRQIAIVPPSPNSHPPVLSLSISPNFVLDLTTTSLMGSRAKLANIPKLHELIQHQVRRVLATRATWKFVLPGLASITQTQEKTKLDYEGDSVSILSS